MVEWGDVESRLRRRCAQRVDVYGRTASRTDVRRVAERGGARAAVSTPQQTQSRAWKVYLEVPYAQVARVCGRVDISCQDQVFRSKGCKHNKLVLVVSVVQSISSHIERSADGGNNELLPVRFDNQSNTPAAAMFDEKVCANIAVTSGQQLPIEDAICGILEPLVEELTAQFYATQTQQAAFELEMLQHHPGLEVLVTTAKETGRVFVQFVLPLFAGAQWDASTILAAEEDAWSIYLPDAFRHPNLTNDLDKPVLSITYDCNQNPSAWCPSSMAIDWPESLKLSSQVTQTPAPQQHLSSVQVLSSCQESFAPRWTKRKDFIKELRAKVIEYDPIDFSRVFFMVQEQIDVDSTLRIVLLSLEFTVEYFLTNCFSDLKLSLLDGGAPVEIRLPSSATSVDAANGPIDKLVVAFLATAREALMSHLSLR
ncbi:hypothetical protein FI667_g10807, partial [Globisporangium splendens]